MRPASAVEILPLGSRFVVQRVPQQVWPRAPAALRCPIASAVARLAPLAIFRLASSSSAAVTSPAALPASSIHGVPNVSVDQYSGLWVYVSRSTPIWVEA